jgi:predicted enzyme related to lactoylglutathione lyase
MVNGIHAIIYTQDAENVRAFFRDTLKLSSVDVGHGWLIFALPPAELGIHPADGEAHTELYLMCDNIQATMKDLAGKGIEFTGPVAEEGWGLTTAIKLPGGGELGIYQPRHPTALGLASAGSSSSKRKPGRAKSGAGKPKPRKRARKAAKRRKR